VLRSPSAHATLTPPIWTYSVSLGTEDFPFEKSLPEDAGGAVAIVHTLVSAGHQALLAGGCVRDLLLGLRPQDYDVATDAPPERVSALFRPTRHVGAQFGVVLVKKRGQWIEVATFRAEGPYLDGRRPVHVTLSDARHDATRRDFTINGMFLDPLGRQVVDYVGGHADLAARLIRAIGEPAQRFDEDYLRLLRAVRFAARLDFAIEPLTLAAIRAHAPKLAQVAAERVREELERMLGHPARQQAWRLCREAGLLPYLWPGAGWTEHELRVIDTLLGRFPPEAPFELVLATLLARRSPAQVEPIARALTLSNEQREMTAWLVAHQADLDDPQAPTLAELKRLMAHRAFAALMTLTRARQKDLADLTSLEKRIAAIPPEAVQPPPLVTGDDLLQRGVAPGPIYTKVLDTLYTQQLNEKLRSRADALAALDHLLRTMQ
jgi:poly(A) polymerase